MEHQNKLPIGVFDTGFGGLSVLQILEKHLPSESFVYLADTAHVPYGNRSEEEIIELCLEWSSFFESKVKLLVLACHTVSVTALEALKQRLSIPILDIASAAKKSLEILQGKILFLGTNATVHSGFFEDRYLQVGCPRLVSLVEEGKTLDPLQELFVYQEYDPDYVVLGCTHFSLLKKRIQTVFPRALLIDPALSLCLEIETFLKDLAHTSWEKNQTMFFVTGNSESFSRIGSQYDPRLKNPICNLFSLNTGCIISYKSVT